NIEQRRHPHAVDGTHSKRVSLRSCFQRYAVSTSFRHSDGRGLATPPSLPARPGMDSLQGLLAMTPRRTSVEHSKGVFNVEWPLFGELSRALALKVSRSYDPEVVVGIATAGVIPGAVIAAILDREFHSIVVSRRYGADAPRDIPAVLGAAPPSVRNRRVLIVDETCDSGDTLRLAVNAITSAGAAAVRTAVGFKTGSYEP